MERTSLHGLIRNAGLSTASVSHRLMVPVSKVEDWVLWKAIPSVNECIQLAELLEVDLQRVYLALLIA